MTDDDYWRKHYQRRLAEGADTLTLEKTKDSDWCHVRMLTNGDPNGGICIRSREMAEHLHFMLGQLLRT